jgi:hypothetical protein
MSDLIPAMRGRLQATGRIKERSSRPSTHASISAYESDVEEDYSVSFREYFCVAADELAGSLAIPLERLGVLYNGILSTGKISRRFRPRGPFRKLDLEQGLNYPTMFGKGQLLFAVRTCDRREAARHMLDGYRFAHGSQVSEIMSKAMIVPRTEVEDIIERLRLYSQPRDPLACGASYLACFVVRACLKRSNCWEILVPTNQPGTLPNVLLSRDALRPAHIRRMQKLEGLSVDQSVQYLNNIAAEIADEDEKEFVEHLHDQIRALTRQVPEEFFNKATFSAAPVPAPGLGGGHYSDSDDYNRTMWPAIYAFSVIPDVHAASVKSGPATVTYVPLSFFQVSQRVYPRAPDHAVFARHVRDEFADLLPPRESRGDDGLLSPPLPVAGSPRGSLPLRAPSTASVRRFGARLSPRPRLARLVMPDAIELVGVPAQPARDSLAPTIRWSDCAPVARGVSPAADQASDGGGRRASAVTSEGGGTDAGETVVGESGSEEVTEVSEGDGAAAEEAESDGPTFVDQLFRVASTRWKKREM